MVNESGEPKTVASDSDEEDEASNSELTKAKPGGKKSWRRFPKRVHFDATGVLKSIGSATLGVARLDTVELSQMNATDETGFYRCLEQIDLTD